MTEALQDPGSARRLGWHVPMVENQQELAIDFVSPLGLYAKKTDQGGYGCLSLKKAGMGTKPGTPALQGELSYAVQEQSKSCQRLFPAR